MKKFVNSLTVFRLLASPLIFISLIYLDFKTLALILFLTAAATDYFDGILARSFDAESRFGEILDPIADKVLLVASLITIILYFESVYVGLISLFLISREFWVSALRIASSSNGGDLSLKVTFLAKLKTTTQFIALSLYFFYKPESSNRVLLSDFILFLSLGFSLKTALDYTKSFYLQLDMNEAKLK